MSHTFTPRELAEAATRAGVRLPKYDAADPRFRTVLAAWRSRHAKVQRETNGLEDFVQWVTSKPPAHRAMERLYRLYLREPFVSEAERARLKRDAHHDASWAELEATSRWEIERSGTFHGYNIVRLGLEPLMGVTTDTRYQMIGFDSALGDVTCWVQRSMLMKLFASLAQRRSCRVEVALGKHQHRPYLGFRWKTTHLNGAVTRGGINLAGDSSTPGDSYNRITVGMVRDQVAVVERESVSVSL